MQISHHSAWSWSMVMVNGNCLLNGLPNSFMANGDVVYLLVIGRYKIVLLFDASFINLRHWFTINLILSRLELACPHNRIEYNENIFSLINIFMAATTIACDSVLHVEVLLRFQQHVVHRIHWILTAYCVGWWSNIIPTRVDLRDAVRFHRRQKDRIFVLRFAVRSIFWQYSENCPLQPGPIGREPKILSYCCWITGLFNLWP